MSGSSRRLEAVVEGRVQGVGYRYYTQRMALRLGLTGWTANLPDGTVRVVAEGIEADLQQFQQFLLQGPSAAVVNDLQSSWSDATGEFPNFRIA